MRVMILILSLCCSITVMAREHVRVVGSSTVYPFVTTVAEYFSHISDYPAPIVESTGTGGGMKLFCSGVGDGYPDIANASRAIKASELALCSKNQVKPPLELRIGFDGIVLANSAESPRYSLTKHHIFLALAKSIPQDGRLVDNPYHYWSDIDASLPHIKIEVYGPPPTSGTRDAFVELVMEPSCKDDPTFMAAFIDKKTRKKMCHLVREDGVYVDAGENDNLILQKLVANTKALGIFGFGFLDQNANLVQGSIIDGIEPSFEQIMQGHYSVSRPLFVYVKQEHLHTVAGLFDFLMELVSEDAIGEAGYLLDKGLIPQSVETIRALQNKLATNK